jgi:hypothetical protein
VKVSKSAASTVSTASTASTLVSLPLSVSPFTKLFYKITALSHPRFKPLSHLPVPVPVPTIKKLFLARKIFPLSVMLAAWKVALLRSDIALARVELAELYAAKPTAVRTGLRLCCRRRVASFPSYFIFLFFYFFIFLFFLFFSYCYSLQCSGGVCQARQRVPAGRQPL